MNGTRGRTIFVLVAGLFLRLTVAALGEEAGAAERVGTTVEDVCRAYPNRVSALLAAIDLDRPGLEAVKAAHDRADTPAACRALLKYYRSAKTAAWLRRQPVVPNGRPAPEADLILQDTFTFYEEQATVPRRSDGGLDWTFRGPTNDREWALALNRHYGLRTLNEAYLKTGKVAYVRCFDEHIRDWVVANPYPNRKANETDNWNGLEAYFRLKVWAEGFYAYQDVESFTPAARLLMLSSIPDHADYLRKYHAPTGNWITMEMHGLAVAGVCWPEFKHADLWVDYAVEQMTEQIHGQVYPDGAQHELTSSYHWVALRNFSEFAELLDHANRPMPETYRTGIERMWNYLAFVLRPDGSGPLNNDADRSSYRERILNAADLWHRPDWRFIATNGREGTAPPGPPSTLFPWAGHLVMRSGWHADAQWGFFDLGPLGSAHYNYDKLHLSITAYGRDLLVDNGRYTYVAGPWRNYFASSAGHNVLLIDGKGQGYYQSIAKTPIRDEAVVQPTFDFARGRFDGPYRKLQGKAAHTRAVVYLRGGYWVVIDHVETDQPRTITALWHLHPDCTTQVEGNTIVTTDQGQGNLRIVPVTNLDWTTTIVRGQTEPTIQGWYSRTYNLKSPSSCAVYDAQVKASASFAWVLAPGRGSTPPVEATWLDAPSGAVRLSVRVGDRPVDEIAVRLTGDKTIELSGGQRFDGACAILEGGSPARVAFGRLVDDHGKTLAEDGR